ncbi:OmpA family protein [Thioclava sp. GXIMD4216]|uniref:OmpA family protein n=1 Tax=Thioclava sp. GXIMD4216 TaxID=3131929 RepID=UPI0030CEA6A3
MKSKLRNTTALIAALATLAPSLTVAQTIPAVPKQAQSEDRPDTDRGKMSSGKEDTGPSQARATTCIETQSKNGVSAKAAAELCEGMTAASPNSQAEKRSEAAQSAQARAQADAQTEAARKKMEARTADPKSDPKPDTGSQGAAPDASPELGTRATSKAKDEGQNTAPAPRADKSGAPQSSAQSSSKPSASDAVKKATSEQADTAKGTPKAQDGTSQAEPKAQPEAGLLGTGKSGTQAGKPELKADAEGGKVDALKRKLGGDSADPATAEQSKPAGAKPADGSTASKTKAGEARDQSDAPQTQPAPSDAADRKGKAAASEQDAAQQESGKTEAQSLSKALAEKQAAQPADPRAAGANAEAAAPRDGKDSRQETQEPRRVEEALQATEDARQRASEGAPVKNEALADKADMPAAGDKPRANSAEGAPMTEEVITKDNARSSAEDFATAVNAKPSGKSPEADKKSGLSDFEKVAIAGLGALAVGAILQNGSEVAVNSGDRVVVQNPDGSYGLIKDDNALLRQPGSTIRTRDYDDGSTRTITERPDGAQIVTIYDAQRRIVQRSRIEPDGTRYILIDDSRGAAPVQVSDLPRANFRDVSSTSNETALRDALARNADVNRGFTLSQIRQIPSVRALAPAISVENVTFATGSAAIQPEQAQALSDLGEAIKARIRENPQEIFLIEGHTDAVGNAAYNLALSDRRAESMALALTEYFDIPPENLVVQGYGEEYLKENTQGASEQNRRVTIRRVTDLLRVAAN